MKNNGDIVQFLKKRDYNMVNNALGSGSFGKTVLLQDPFIDELLVAKKYEPDTDDTELKERFYKNFLEEIKILFKLNHKNIVRIYNYYAYVEKFTGFILMEYIDGHNIGDFISNYNPPFATVTLDNIFVQLIDGFSFIENNGIIHRDIRENNILIDKSGIVKIIDFGIGKVIEKGEALNDSLASKINRERSDTLPQEYYEGVYTSKTDIFYLGELLNRLVKTELSKHSFLDAEFSYFYILDKMMMKKPNDRFTKFSDIREAIDKYDFINMEISPSDKQIYQDFTDSLRYSINHFIDERKFNNNIDHFISQIEKVIRDNCFEDIVQNNSEVIRSIVSGGYNFKSSYEISCYHVKAFYNWFKKSSLQSQQLIFNNIISKLSSIDVVLDICDVPF
jgi:serine/threonine-protein kinase